MAQDPTEVTHCGTPTRAMYDYLAEVRALLIKAGMDEVTATTTAADAFGAALRYADARRREEGDDGA